MTHLSPSKVKCSVRLLRIVLSQMKIKSIRVVNGYLYKFVALVIDDVIDGLRGITFAVKAQEVHEAIDLHLIIKESCSLSLLCKLYF